MFVQVCCKVSFQKVVLIHEKNRICICTTNLIACCVSTNALSKPANNQRATSPNTVVTNNSKPRQFNSPSGLYSEQNVVTAQQAHNRFVFDASSFI